jgi:hypothetical protein
LDRGHFPKTNACARSAPKVFQKKPEIFDAEICEVFFSGLSPKGEQFGTLAKNCSPGNAPCFGKITFDEQQHRFNPVKNEKERGAHGLGETWQNESRVLLQKRKATRWNLEEDVLR